MRQPEEEIIRKGTKMGMYTELYLNVKLRGDTPPAILDALRACTRPGLQEFPKLPDDLLVLDRICCCGSYCFQSESFRQFRELNKVDNTYALAFCTNITNYHGEWLELLALLSPWIDTVGYIGHIRYEEADEPTLLYKTHQGEIESKGGTYFDSAGAVTILRSP